MEDRAAHFLPAVRVRRRRDRRRGDASLQTAAVRAGGTGAAARRHRPPYRLQPARGRGRPPLLALEDAALQPSPPVIPLSPLERGTSIPAGSTRRWPSPTLPSAAPDTVSRPCARPHRRRPSRQPRTPPASRRSRPTPGSRTRSEPAPPSRSSDLSYRTRPAGHARALDWVVDVGDRSQPSLGVSKAASAASAIARIVLSVLRTPAIVSPTGAPEDAIGIVMPQPSIWFTMGVLRTISPLILR